MQCRICLEEGGDVLSPCRCQGTSAYIHRACLLKYIAYYPDRVCRTCRTFMEAPLSWESVLLLWGTGLLLCTLVLLSQVRVLLKLALFAGILALWVYYGRTGLFSRTSTVMVLVSMTLFLPTGDPYAAGMMMTCILLFLGCATAAVTIPLHYVITVVGNLLVTAYMSVVLWGLYTVLDPPAFTTVFSLLCLLWYAWMHRITTLRLRLE